MRFLNTCVCGAVLMIMLSGAAMAQSVALHPQLGKKPPRETLNSDLMKLPEHERLAWIHGAMAQTAQILATYNPKASKCVMVYFFEEGRGLEAAANWSKQLPDQAATATIQAIAKKVCSSL